MFFPRVSKKFSLIVLAVVLAGIFGVATCTVHFALDRVHWDLVDRELISLARLIEGAMRGVSDPVLESLGSEIAFPTQPGHPAPPSHLHHHPPALPELDESALDRRQRTAPIPPASQESEFAIDWESFVAFREEFESDEAWEASLNLPSQLKLQRYHDDEQPYFVIWRPDNSIFREFNVPHPDLRQAPVDEPPKRKAHIFGRGEYREAYVLGPRDYRVCVGRSARHEHRRSFHGSLSTMAAGIGAWGLTLSIVWFSMRGILKPLNRISRFCQKIGPHSLYHRLGGPLKDPDSRRCIENLNEMMDRLETAGKEQQRFLADAAHELRTPLMVMLANAEFGLFREREAVEYREHLMICAHSATRLKNLVDQLLMALRLEQTNSESTPVSVDFTRLVHHEVQLLNLVASQKQVQLTCELDEVTMMADPEQLARLVNNLVINAINYSQPSKDVLVRLRRIDGRIEFSVIDQGPGIAEQDLPRIFDRFYRSESSRLWNFEGNGLGLAICKKIVDRHQGEILVESKLAQGTTFRVIFPAST